MLTTLKRLMPATVIGLVLIGCQGVPADYKPDPTLLTATPAALKKRVVNACIASQRTKSSLSTPVLRQRCGCYTDRTFKTMDAEELKFYRNNGYFNDSTRPDGRAALEACGLVG